MAPDLVAKHWRRDHTVASAMMGGAWIAHITGPRTIPMMVQYVLVREALEGVELTHGRPDSLIWWWSSTRVYSASSAFNTMFLGQPQVPRSFELLEKCRFFWVACSSRQSLDIRSVMAPWPAG
jgi:hypothetical protein